MEGVLDRASVSTADDNRRLTRQPPVVMMAAMTTKQDTAARQETLNRVRELRAQAIKHTILAREFSAQRRELLRELMDDGMSQAEIARELGVTRQAIQKMLAC
jgi:DNA invertase Pin-like site-specific DNA recombinase